MGMNFEALDWTRLDRLRALFLEGRFGSEPYWRDEADLEVYDATLGERIGWKWDAVLRELALRHWSPPAGCALWDWGCGSGVAGRRVVAAWPDAFSQVRITDHASLAANFAARRLRQEFPGLPVSTGTFAPSDAGDCVLCVSHVGNELAPEAAEALHQVAASARAIIWVEPGTHAAARALQQTRDRMVAEAGHWIVAPCTHQMGCGLLHPGNERHWCHHFAEPPPAIFANSDWVRFGRRAGVDLRAVPYAFLTSERGPRRGMSVEPPRLQRLLGSPRVYKGYARALLCGQDGVTKQEVPQRSAPKVYKDWSKERGGVLYETEPDPGRTGRVSRIDPWPRATEWDA